MNMIKSDYKQTRKNAAFDKLVFEYKVVRLRFPFSLQTFFKNSTKIPNFTVCSRCNLWSGHGVGISDCTRLRCHRSASGVDFRSCLQHFRLPVWSKKRFNSKLTRGAAQVTLSTFTYLSSTGATNDVGQ